MDAAEMMRIAKAGLAVVLSMSLVAAPVEAKKKRKSSLRQERALFEIASRLYREKDLPAAVAEYERFLMRFPKSSRAADARFMIGEAHLARAVDLLKADLKVPRADRIMRGKNKAAHAALESARLAYEAVLRKHRGKNGLRSSAQYRLGEVAYNAQDWGRAIEQFREVETEFPQSYLVPEAWMGVVFTNLAMEQRSQAEANMFLLIETYPQYFRSREVLFARGIVSLYNHAFSDAQESLKKVPTAKAKYFLGRAYLEAGQPLLAALAFARIVREHPDSPISGKAVFWTAEALFVAKDYDSAIANYRRFLAKSTGSGSESAALFKIGASFLQKGEYAEARRQLQRVVDEHPKDLIRIVARYYIAESLLAAKRHAEAAEAFKTARERGMPVIAVPALSSYKLAWSLYQAGEYDRAERACKDFLSMFPRHQLGKNVHLILGNALLRGGRHDDAVNAFRRITELAPESEIAEQGLLSMLQVQYERKAYDAITTSSQFIFRHLPPTNSKWRPLSYLYAAKAYMKLNRIDEAKALYQMILKVYPNGRAALQAQDGLARCYTAEGNDDMALRERRRLKEMLRLAGLSASGGKRASEGRRVSGGNTSFRLAPESGGGKGDAVLGMRIDPFETIRDSLAPDPRLMEQGFYQVERLRNNPDFLRNPRVVRPWLATIGGLEPMLFGPRNELAQSLHYRPSEGEFKKSNWSLTITDDEGKVFEHRRGDGLPPEEIAWSGQNQQGEWVGAGVAYSPVYEFSSPDEMPLRRVGKPVKLGGVVHQERTGLHITLDSSVLFGKSKKSRNIRRRGDELLREAADLIKRRYYGMPIRVEVYGGSRYLADEQARLVESSLQAELKMLPNDILSGSVAAPFAMQRVEIVLQNR